MQGMIRILDPVGPIRQLRIKPARWPATLDGLPIGILDNAKHNGNILLDAIGSWLVAERGAKVVMTLRKSSPASAAPIDYYVDLAQQVRAVVTGPGD